MEKEKREIVKLEKVTKIYHLGEHRVHALNGISISIRNGEFVAIMGPSGSGKSTLLNMIGCLDIPTEGRVLIDGVSTADMSEEELTLIRRDRIGFVFQSFNLIPTLSARENVELPMIFRRVGEDERIKRAQKLLEMVDMGGKINHRPSELSGGEQQRVAIARALANDPAIILADEPTGNLDTASGNEIMKIMRDLNDMGRTIIVVTHDPSVADFAERIIRIRDGRLDVS